MNQTQQRGFDQVRSAYDFIAEQVATYNTKQIKKQRYRKSLVKRMAATATAIMLTLVVNLPHLKAEEELRVEPVQQPIFDTTVRLDSNNYSLLVIDDPKVEIKPGKSLAQVQYEQAQARKAAPKQQTVAMVQVAVRQIPAEERHRMAQEAAAKVGIPGQWKTLAAIWAVETGGKEGCIISKADGRATGPMQFMPPTFRAYGSGNICEAKPSLEAAANLLKRSGIEEDPVKAIHNYNHSMAYVKKVQSVANSIN